jgi:glutathione S-transferase
VKLINDATSPFGRKILVACIERLISLEEEFVDMNKPGPVDDLNALRQIPTLLVDGTQAIFDSDVILGYLDSVHHGAALLPTHGRWEILTRTSLGNGLMETVLQRMMEARRPATEKSAAFILKMEQRISRVLAYLDSAVTSLEGEPLRVDQITIACALEYVDLRFTAKWRERFPAISDWLAEISIRPSMIATAPRRTDPISVR